MHLVYKITSGAEGAKQPAILQMECQKMTFKLKSVLQRQCCNAWTEFRGCALQGDRSRAVSGQEACSPCISLAASAPPASLPDLKQGQAPAILYALLVDINRVVETGLH